MCVVRFSRPRRRRLYGAAAVEFALALPLLMTIVFGCVDFGRFAHTHIAVTNAARTGAGFASSHPFTVTTQGMWEQKVREAVATDMGTAFDTNQISMPSPVITTEGDGLKRVRIEVSYPFETLISWPFLPQSITLARAVEMRVIR